LQTLEDPRSKWGGVWGKPDDMRPAFAFCFRLLVLQSAKPLADAIRLYKKLGYEIIPNYGL